MLVMVTKIDGKRLVINVAIAAFEETDGNTIVHVNGKTFEIRENLNDIRYALSQMVQSELPDNVRILK
ncbi:MAG: hypothetical protein QXT45_04435 [Candidatus Bilamarchaeaceae archaeon]